MTELHLRSISGLLYVALLVSSAGWSDFAFFSVVFVFSSLALWEFQKLIQHRSPITFLLFGLLTFQLYQEKLVPNLHFMLLWLTLMTSGYLTYCLLAHKEISIAPFQKSGLTIFYLIGSAYFIMACIQLEGIHKNSIAIIMYLLIWFNNSFAYLFGKRWGKNKLFPSISPKKTWEGFLGGALPCFLLGIGLMLFESPYPKWTFPVLALIIVVSATLGDLIQSKFKRQANVKDSGTLIPGHGGFYDRMDSVLYSAPFVYLFIKFTDYVS